ncbi:MAG: DUF2784 domain-containing protein [Saprospiraceae bacterium]|nr:DUF2784 domain-containing protein [Saprospiraceae bacterium]
MQLLDILLTTVHAAVIVFNCVGWIWKRTRRSHLWCMGLTAGSWFVLGIWKGWGYCFLTDWAWTVKRQLGETDLPASFIHYGVQKLGINVAPQTTDLVTLIVFGLCICFTVYVNWIRGFKDSRI